MMAVRDGGMIPRSTGGVYHGRPQAMVKPVEEAIQAETGLLDALLSI